MVQYIKGTDESTLVTDSSAPLLHHDPSDLRSLILIQKRELTIDVALAVEDDLSRSPLHTWVCLTYTTFEHGSVSILKVLILLV